MFSKNTSITCVITVTIVAINKRQRLANGISTVVGYLSRHPRLGVHYLFVAVDTVVVVVVRINNDVFSVDNDNRLGRERDAEHSAQVVNLGSRLSNSFSSSVMLHQTSLSVCPYIRKGLSRINWIYYWRSFCTTHEHYNYLQLMYLIKCYIKKSLSVCP